MHKVFHDIFNVLMAPLQFSKYEREYHAGTTSNTDIRTYCISLIRCRSYNCFRHSFFWQVLFEGSDYFCGKPADVNDGWIRYIRAIQWRLLDTDSSSHSLSVLLSAIESSCRTPTTLAQAWWPSSEIICTHVRVSWLLFEGAWDLICSEFPNLRLRVATIWEGQLFEGSIYLNKYGMFATVKSLLPSFWLPGGNLCHPQYWDDKIVLPLWS